MEAVLVGRRVNGDGFYSHFAAGADNPHGYLASVGDKYFLIIGTFLLSLYLKQDLIRFYKVSV